jgi:hypothetical protein
MVRTSLIRIIALAAAAAALASCGPPPYSMSPPASFKRFEESRDFKWITADGVMLKAREVDNYPEAPLDFWVDAMSRHMIAQGYVQKGEQRCFDTKRGRKACTAEFMLPHGAEDWVLSETVFVVEDDLVLVEAAGPYERYALVEKELQKAVATFEPRE